jgi:hypothetical protein
MPRGEEMCKKCGTLEGVCLVYKTCESCAALMRPRYEVVDVEEFRQSAHRFIKQEAVDSTLAYIAAQGFKIVREVE